MNKYHSKKWYCIADHKHDSKKEAKACDTLRLLERTGKIKDLKQQPKFTLQEGFKRADGKKVRPITYRADFSFYDNDHDRFRVIDTKGYKTQVYRLKEKMFNKIMANRGIQIEYEI